MREDTRSSTLKTLLDGYERQLIEAALRANGGNQRRAATALGILPTTLHEKMKRLGMTRREVGYPRLVTADLQGATA